MTAKTPRRRFSATRSEVSPEEALSINPLDDGVNSMSSTSSSEEKAIAPNTEAVSETSSAGVSDFVSSEIQPSSTEPLPVASETPTTGNFNDAYRRLQDGVTRLRQTDLSNIDELVPLVQQTTQAYQDCKARLVAVEQLIQGTLKDQ